MPKGVTITRISSREFQAALSKSATPKPVSRPRKIASRNIKSCPSCGAYGNTHFKGCKPFSVVWWKPPELPWIAATFCGRLPDSVYLVEFDSEPLPIGHPIIEFIISDMKESGWSANYVANRAGLNPVTIRQWFERRATRPHHKTISRVLDVLGWRTLPLLQPS